MRFWTIGLFLGTVCVHQWSTLTQSYERAIILILCISATAWALRKPRVPLWILAGFCLGIYWTDYVASSQLAQRFPSIFEKNKMLVEGTISGLVHEDPMTHQKSFRFDVENLYDASGKTQYAWRGVILLHWPWSPKYHLDHLRVAQKWRFPVSIHRPHSYANPGGIDTEAGFLQKRLTGVGYVSLSKGGMAPKFLGLRSNGYYLSRIRWYFDQKLMFLMRGRDTKILNLLRALAFGESELLYSDQWEVLQKTGTSHLLAISGLHVGLLIGLMCVLASWVWRCYAPVNALLWFPAPLFGGAVAWLSALLYAGLAGFSLPTQRTFIMASVWLLSLFCRKHLPNWHAFALSLAIILLHDPLAPLSAGFWLSFGAVAFILCFSQQQQKRGIEWVSLPGGKVFFQKLILWSKLQWTLTLGLAPLTLFFFHQVSLVSFFANAFAIPFIGFLILPLILLAIFLLWPFPFLAKNVLLGAYCGLSVLWKMLEGYSQIFPWMYSMGGLSVWRCVLALLGILAFVNAWLPKWRWGILGVGCLAILAQPAYRLGKGDFVMDVLDVGQGLAVFIKTRSHALLYDTGPKWGVSRDAAQSVIIPFLKHYGISRLNTLIVSHADSDHSGGVRSIAENIQVDQVWSSELKAYAPSLIPRFCLAGDAWNWDGVHFQFLYPDVSHLGTRNNSSCVLKVSVGSKSVLLMGDLEREGEAALALKLPPKSASEETILVVPHHGSKTSSSLVLLERLTPKLGIIASGYLNRFHFPNSTVVKRYQNLGIPLMNTAHAGDIRIKYRKKTSEWCVESFRFLKRRYWKE